jgi:CheY-like chemotaxis protein
MDDEPIIREMAARMLESVGYEVTVVRDGAQAVDVYARALDAGRRFDVVILDVTVPGGLGGREALTAISRIDPGVAAILSSGYGRELALPDGPRTILPKPYRRHELLGCVAAVISTGRAPDGPVRARPVP